jgi:hypothetical protein
MSSTIAKNWSVSTLMRGACSCTGDVGSIAQTYWCWCAGATRAQSTMHQSGMTTAHQHQRSPNTMVGLWCDLINATTDMS